MDSKRFVAGVEYDGNGFRGYQSQSHALSVQDSIEAALSKVANAPIRTLCAGRTDAGVHAYGQIIHFDTSVERSAREWLRGVNSNLPKTVCFHWVCPIDNNFHARACAIRRHYRYVILNSPVASPIMHGYSARVSEPLDEKAMHSSAQCLIGSYDFSSFRSAGCNAKSPVKKMKHINVHRKGCFIYIDVCANAFLQHMVRSIVGTLVAVGNKEREQGWVKEVLECRDRRQGGITMPGSGLYLVAIEYDKQYSLPNEMRIPQFS